MNMIGHEAIGEDINAVFRTILAQPGEIDGSILVCEKDILAAITALGNVVGDICENGSGDPWHAGRLAD
jgi:hypothetical protein